MKAKRTTERRTSTQEVRRNATGAVGVGSALGGRSTDELIFEDVSTGSADDIARATRMPAEMAAEFGISGASAPPLSPSVRGERRMVVLDSRRGGS